MFEDMSRTVAATAGSVFIISSTLRIEARTVEWLRPSYWVPISTRERFVRLRIRYMETWRAMAMFLLRRCPRRSEGWRE